MTVAEILDMDSRTIINIEKGEGNPVFENLCSIINYLHIPYSLIFETSTSELSPSVQKLISLLSDCTEQDATDLIPIIIQIVTLLRR